MKKTIKSVDGTLLKGDKFTFILNQDEDLLEGTSAVSGERIESNDVSLISKMYQAKVTEIPVEVVSQGGNLVLKYETDFFDGKSSENAVSENAKDKSSNTSQEVQKRVFKQPVEFIPLKMEDRVKMNKKKGLDLDCTLVNDFITHEGLKLVKVSEDWDTFNIYEADKITLNVETFSLGTITVEFLQKENEEQVVEEVTAAPAYVSENSGVDEETWNNISDLLDVYGANEKLKQAVFNRYRPIPEEDRKLIPNPKVLYDDMNNEMVSIIASAVSGNGVMLLGPASSGKNTAINTLAYILQLPLIDVSITDEMSKMDLVGAEGLVVEEHAGQYSTVTAFKKEKMLEAIEKGYMVNLDEINLGRSDVIMQLNALLDFRGQTHISGLGQVTKHPTTVITATGNEGATYVGTKSINPAFKSRFSVHQLTPIQSIRSLLENECEDDSVVTALDAVYKSFREEVNNGSIDVDPSFVTPRCYEAAAKMIGFGTDFETAVINCIINQSSLTSCRSYAKRKLGNMPEVLDLLDEDLEEAIEL